MFFPKDKEIAQIGDFFTAECVPAHKSNQKVQKASFTLDILTNQIIAQTPNAFSIIGVCIRESPLE
jgi:hypothetical protein